MPVELTELTKEQKDDRLWIVLEAMERHAEELADAAKVEGTPLDVVDAINHVAARLRALHSVYLDTLIQL